LIINFNIKNLSEDIFVLADNLLDQLFINLFTNAIKNDLNENIVRIEIDISQNSEKNACLIIISDHGKGIHPNLRENIFFIQNEYKNVNKRPKLGLNIVYSLIKRYKGDIKIENLNDKNFEEGTKISIQLLKA